MFSRANASTTSKADRFGEGCPKECERCRWTKMITEKVLHPESTGRASLLHAERSPAQVAPGLIVRVPRSSTEELSIVRSSTTN